MKKMQSKMTALEWPQPISNCKSMGIFPDPQRQLTPQSVVGFGGNSNSVKTLWLSLLPARRMKIHLKMKALEWPQGYKSIFQTFKDR